MDQVPVTRSERDGYPAIVLDSSALKHDLATLVQRVKQLVAESDTKRGVYITIPTMRAPTEPVDTLRPHEFELYIGHYAMYLRSRALAMILEPALMLEYTVDQDDGSGCYFIRL